MHFLSVYFFSGSAMKAAEMATTTRLLFATSLHCKALARVLPPQCNTALADFGSRQFEAFRRQVLQGAPQSENVPPSTLNNQFFHMQMQQIKGQGHWEPMEELPEFKLLKAQVVLAAREFLALHGRTEPILTEGGSPQELYAWASVHGRGSRHDAHSHADSMLSAVYYARLPDPCARIVFFDPRGRNSFHPKLPTAPPFDSSFALQPKEGDLIVFPGWLLHAVEESQADAERISFSFNVRGRWGTVSDLHMELGAHGREG